VKIEPIYTKGGWDMKRQLGYVGMALAVLALATASVASGKWEIVRAGNLVFGDNGGISPTQLPRHGFAPATARIIGKIGTADGTHPPALQHVELDVDRTIRVDAAGLPTCRLSQLQARSTADAKRACGDAIIGSGSTEVEVAFPEQAPFSSTGPLVLFNAGVSGKTTKVLLHAYVDVPAPTAIVVPATVTRIDKGRFGLHLDATIPRIAGGAGSATRFELKIGRRFTYMGQKKSFLSAGCPTGSWMTKGHAEFSDGTDAALTHLFSCTPEGGSR
jgi:hypothetical protein